MRRRDHPSSSANVDPRKLLPLPDRTGTPSVTVTLDGTGKWSNPRNGAGTRSVPDGCDHRQPEAFVHLRMDGSDSNVKVTTTHHNFVARPYNLPLQGYDGNGGTKAKLSFFDLTTPAETRTVEGTQVIDNFNPVDGPDHSSFPLRATVKWKITVR